MLSDFYNEQITIKYNRSGDDYAGFTYDEKIIDGAVQHKRRKVVDNRGEEVISESTLFTNEILTIDDLIVYNSRDREIMGILPIRDHFGDGEVDHYEVYF